MIGPWFLTPATVTAGRDSRIISRNMAAENPDHERERLTQVYAGMSEGELQKIADAAPDLTDVARQALANEIARRGLSVRLADYIAVDELEQRELVTIRKFRDLPEAVLAKGMLDSAGIESYLADDAMVRMDWFISNLLGGIKLEVKPEDAEAALEVLHQPIPESFDVEGAGTYVQPNCPKCQSVDITFEALDKPIAYVSAWLFVPIPLAKETWKCESCGHTWADAPDPDT